MNGSPKKDEKRSSQGYVEEDDDAEGSNSLQPSLSLRNPVLEVDPMTKHQR